MAGLVIYMDIKYAAGAGRTGAAIFGAVEIEMYLERK